MSSSTTRVGFVGLSTSRGWASVGLAPTLLHPSLQGKYTITAVCTSSPTSSTATAQKYTAELGHEVKSYHGDASQLANDPDVDFVVVALRPALSNAALERVIAAGKDFFTEWPGACSLEEIRDIAEAAKKKGVRSMVGFQGRQSSTLRKVKELIDSGRIGKIHSTSIIALAARELAFFGPNIKDGSQRTADKTQASDMLMIAVGHQLDTLTYLLGDFASVSATTTRIYDTATLVDDQNKPTGQTIPITTQDHVAFSGILNSGALASVVWRGGYSATKGRRTLLWEIDGEDGSIRLESNVVHGPFMHIWEPELYLNGERVEVEGAGGMVGNLTSAWGEFAKGEVGSYATIEDAVRNYQLIDAIQRSADEGRTVKL